MDDREALDLLKIENSRLRAALDVAKGAINATLDYIGLPDEDWPRERHTIYIKNRMSIDEIRKAKAT